MSSTGGGCSAPVNAFVGQSVKNRGRTSGLTRTTVTVLNVTVSVAYDNECAGGSAFVKEVGNSLGHDDLSGIGNEHESGEKRRNHAGEGRDRVDVPGGTEERGRTITSTAARKPTGSTSSRSGFRSQGVSRNHTPARANNRAK